MHPYEMYQLSLQRRDHRLVKIRPGTLYHAVRRLGESGLVAALGTEREGNRPERTTYEITDAGRDQLRPTSPRCWPRWLTSTRSSPSPSARRTTSPRTRSIRLLTTRIRAPGDASARSRPASPGPREEPAVGLLAPARVPAHRAQRSGRLARERHHRHGFRPLRRPRNLPPRSKEKQPRERDNLQTVAGPVGPGHRLLHDPGRLDHRVGRQPGHPARPGRRHHLGDLGDQRLPARVRRPAADHRPARRPLRTQADLHDRAGRLHRRLRSGAGFAGDITRWSPRGSSRASAPR